MPKLVEIDTDDVNTVTKPLSRQTSVQSTKSVSSITTPAEVSESQSAAIAGVTTPSEGSLSRASSVKRDSTTSRNSVTAGGEQEPLIEQNETTELLCEL